MRIETGPDDSETSTASLYLTQSEARELRSALDDMLGQEPPDLNWHTHVSSADYQTEIALAWSANP